MRNLPFLLLLSARLAASWGHSADIFPAPCSDRTVAHRAQLALSYINEDRTEGYKFSLNRVNNVHLHEQGPAGTVFYLDLDVLETKCYVKSPRAWEDCEIRPFAETKSSGNCKTILLSTPQGPTYLYSYDCNLIPDQPEKVRSICPDCPLLLPVDSPEALQAAQVSLDEYNRARAAPAAFSLLNVTRASSQTNPEHVSFVEYTIQDTGCSKQHGDTDGHPCIPKASDTAAGFCVAAVFPRGIGEPTVEVSCEIYNVMGAAAVDRAVGGVPAGPDTNREPLGAQVTPVPPREGPRRRPKPTPPGYPYPKLPAAPEPRRFRLSSESESSEEGGVMPPGNFKWPGAPRQRRNAATPGPAPLPVFLTVFPDSPSPACPGAPRHEVL
ncbi:FETUB protein, partial [Atractosteus spatula]|nr:FETUB protein [Atractosteus spatula]